MNINSLTCSPWQLAVEAREIKSYIARRYRVVAAFSTSASALILLLNSDKDSRQLVLNLQLIGSYAALFHQVFDEYQPSKKREPVFEQLIGQELLTAEAATDDRIMRLELGAYFLYFKMFGRNANALLYKKSSEKPMSILHKHLQSDKQQEVSSLNSLNYASDPSTLEAPHEAIKLFVGNVADFEYYTQYRISVRKLLGAAHLADAQKILILNRERYLKQLERKKVSTLKSIETLRLDNSVAVADTIMANLHQLLVKPIKQQISLINVHTGVELTVKLKAKEAASDYASRLYSKARLIPKQLKELEEKAEQLASEAAILEEEISHIKATITLKELRTYEKQEASEKNVSTSFYRFNSKGYHIWAGRNAKENDQLTTSVAHKNDVWLHARGTSGSHVIVRAEGRQVPQEVIRTAAGIAGYYSKAKGSELVPVAYALSKFVRKPKGAHPGAVIMMREEVMLVAPELPVRER